MPEKNITAYWSDTLKHLEREVSKVSYETWFQTLIPVSIDDGVFTFKTLDSFHKNTIDQRYLRLFNSCLKEATGLDIVADILLPDGEPVSAVQKKPNSPNDYVDPLDIQSTLNSKYIFDTFVVGNSNRLAHAASVAVAESPADAYNPLFLYGGVGLGKTHLMHSIAHHILNQNPNAKVMYASSEKFTNELINSIKDNKNQDFRNKYRNIDVLLIDDIQFLSEKEVTQEEFFHTFNTLYEARKQIIISSDRPPKEIRTLEDRLRSRFEWGLIADIKLPDFETRTAILDKKAELDRIFVPKDVSQFIAKSIVSNIRELEGALTRVIAYCSLANKEVDVLLAEEALKELLQENEKREVTIDSIQEVVADFYNIKVEDIKSKKRSQNIVYPRQVAMYLSRKILELPLARIGEYFGGRDHSTVIHGCDKISDELERDKTLQRQLVEIENKIMNP